MPLQVPAHICAGVKDGPHAGVPEEEALHRRKCVVSNVAHRPREQRFAIAGKVGLEIADYGDLIAPVPLAQLQHDLEAEASRRREIDQVGWAAEGAAVEFREANEVGYAELWVEGDGVAVEADLNILGGCRGGASATIGRCRRRSGGKFGDESVDLGRVVRRDDGEVAPVGA